jgi:hypothetical protein
MLLDDIYAYLTDLGLVNGTTRWPCYEGYMTDDQDQTVALYETGGFPADTLLRENQRVTFQIRVRGSRRDYATVRQKWQDLFNALQDAPTTTGHLPGVVFIQAMHYGPLVFTDDKSRVNMTVNFRVMRQPSDIAV